MEIIQNCLDMSVGSGFSFDDPDHCLPPFDLARKSGLKKMQFASGDEENTKRGLASEPGILMSARDPCSRLVSVENSHVRGASPQLGLTGAAGWESAGVPTSPLHSALFLGLEGGCLLFILSLQKRSLGRNQYQPSEWAGSPLHSALKLLLMPGAAMSFLWDRQCWLC